MIFFVYAQKRTKILFLHTHLKIQEVEKNTQQITIVKMLLLVALKYHTQKKMLFITKNK